MQENVPSKGRSQRIKQDFVGKIPNVNKTVEIPKWGVREGGPPFGKFPHIITFFVSEAVPKGENRSNPTFFLDAPASVR